ncbi:MAG: NHLP family bacteriocin export ABC transporter permease/ATPase subunit, partial [Oscillospiraceae bacterium]|nr:NHLP family bacteriocin export ABC transporter permease/ATPase subunit [Oscillospiraceae bacterium]
MGLFDEQIRLRKERDQEAFEDSIFEMASVVGKRGAGGMRDRRVVTRAAIDELLKYYGVKPVEIPRSVETMEDQLDYALKPHGLMYRPITLSEDWYKSSFGPIMAFYKDSGLPVVLLPKKYGGYFWQDADGKKVTAK